MIHKGEASTTIYSDIGPIVVPVLFTDCFRESNNDLYNLAYCSAIGGFSPYLFAGYFFGEKLNRWFISNARRHVELKQAVYKHLRKDDLGYVYGQIYFDPRLKEQGDLKFTHIVLHSALPNRRAELSLLGVVDKEFRVNDFEFRRAKF